jgi:hypothetical protein
LEGQAIHHRKGAGNLERMREDYKNICGEKDGSV